MHPWTTWSSSLKNGFSRGGHFKEEDEGASASKKCPLEVQDPAMPKGCRRSHTHRGHAIWPFPDDLRETNAWSTAGPLAMKKLRRSLDPVNQPATSPAPMPA